MEVNCPLWNISHFTLQTYKDFSDGTPCNLLTLHLAHAGVTPYTGSITFYNVDPKLANALLLAAPQPTQELTEPTEATGTGRIYPDVSNL